MHTSAGALEQSARQASLNVAVVGLQWSQQARVGRAAAHSVPCAPRCVYILQHLHVVPPSPPPIGQLARRLHAVPPSPSLIGQLARRLHAVPLSPPPIGQLASPRRRAPPAGGGPLGSARLLRKPGFLEA
uniref:Uncharacterized protein n=1 Tax=Rangifer tarandus platyrhynchus TaxID=3082113 RepID=A0ACB0DXZ3_RANTA|nr:unnamed protein product [Rangifer tarandus platyrhynchus]